MDSKSVVLPESLRELMVQISLGVSPLPIMAIFRKVTPGPAKRMRECSICGDTIHKGDMCYKRKFGYNGSVINAHAECAFIPINRLLVQEKHE